MQELAQLPFAQLPSSCPDSSPETEACSSPGSSPSPRLSPPLGTNHHTDLPARPGGLHTHTRALTHVHTAPPTIPSQRQSQACVPHPKKTLLLMSEKVLPMPSFRSYMVLCLELPQWLSSKEFTCNAGQGGQGKSTRGENGNPFQYSCQKNPFGLQRVRHD